MPSGRARPGRVLEADHVWTTAQALEERVEPLAAAPIVGWQIVGQRHVGDRLDRASQVIEDEQRIDHHQVRQR